MLIVVAMSRVRLKPSMPGCVNRIAVFLKKEARP